MIHSCGSVYEIIPDIIKAGFDILNPIQIVAKGMDPKKLKINLEKIILQGWRSKYTEDINVWYS